MVRPQHQDPTPAELEVLEAFWKDERPKTVRDVKTALDRNRPRAYTTVMTLMNVMVVKGLLNADTAKRPFVYSAAVTETKAKSRLLRDFCARVFNGSTDALVEGLLREVKPNSNELRRINKAIEKYAQTKEGIQCESSNSCQAPSPVK